MISASITSQKIPKNGLYLQNKFSIGNLIFQLEKFRLKFGEAGVF